MTGVFQHIDCGKDSEALSVAVGRYTMVSMNVPEPVMSLAVMPKSRDGTGNFSKALNRCGTRSGQSCLRDHIHALLWILRSP